MGSVLDLKLHLASDWTAFERNQLHALVARLSTHSAEDIAFGVSDEGDPWCAILDDSEDVILHVAKIRGRFVVHAAQENAIAEARDLWSAVTYFTAANTPGAASQRSDVLPDHIFAAMAVEDAREIAPPPAEPVRAEEPSFAPHTVVMAALADDDHVSIHEEPPAPAPGLGDAAEPAPVATGLSYEPLIATAKMIAATAIEAAIPAAAPTVAEGASAIRLEAAAAPDPAAAAQSAATHAVQPPASVAAPAHDALLTASLGAHAPLLGDPRLDLGADDGGAPQENALRSAPADQATPPAPTATPAGATPNVLLVGGWMPSEHGGQTFGIVAEVVGGRSGLYQSPPGAHVDFIAIAAGGATTSASHPGLDPDGPNLAPGVHVGSITMHAPPMPANDFMPLQADHLPMEPAIHAAAGVWAAPDPLHGP